MTDNRRPLILSALAHDIHASAACWALERHGLSPLWVRSWADPSMPPVSLHCDADSGLRAPADANAAFRSVWFRRPRMPEDFPQALEADVPFLRTEWRRHSNNLHALARQATGALWVNPPAAALAAENKMVQLQAAHEAGLAFPATLMSSDPVEIRRFAAEHGAVVYKPFQSHTWQDAATGRMFSSYARVVDAQMLLDDASLRQCPGIYQKLVDKRYDLRVTVIGEHAFAARLDTPPQRDFIDWRIASLAETMRASAADLPSAYLDRLRDFMRRLGIVFGCVDLAVDPDGTPHFLEVNQAGQFLFVEQAVPSLPLLRATCALLAQGRSDYSLDAAPRLSYQEYLDSDRHHQWWETASAGLRRTDGVIHGVTIE
jgi:glutathione synthase/RimK-type ligase-like ATP-grasp enzyme